MGAKWGQCTLHMLTSSHPLCPLAQSHTTHTLPWITSLGLKMKRRRCQHQQMPCSDSGGTSAFSVSLWNPWFVYAVVLYIGLGKAWPILSGFVFFCKCWTQWTWNGAQEHQGQRLEVRQALSGALDSGCFLPLAIIWWFFYFLLFVLLHNCGLLQSASNVFQWISSWHLVELSKDNLSEIKPGSDMWLAETGVDVENRNEHCAYWNLGCNTDRMECCKLIFYCSQDFEKETEKAFFCRW